MSGFVHRWSDLTVWPQGVLVRYNKGLYKAMGQQNVALPSEGILRKILCKLYMSTKWGSLGATHAELYRVRIAYQKSVVGIL